MRLESLTFLRFIAALVVVIFHYGRSLDEIKALPDILQVGPYMVTFFFVLSGFVMALAHYNKPLNNADFYIKRFARLFPVCTLALIAYILVDNISILEQWKSFLLQLTLIHSWFPPYPLSLNTPAWSLSVEVFFYAIFPIIFIAFKGWKVAGFLAITAWILTQVVYTNLLNNGFYTGYPSVSHDLIHYFPLGHVCSFLLGYASGICFLENRHKIVWRSEASVILPLTGIFVASVAIQNLSVLQDAIGMSLPLAASFLSILFVILIMSFACGRNSLVNVCSSRPFQVLGNASFGIYILQKPVYIFFRDYISRPLDMGPQETFYIYTVFLIAISIGVYYAFEKPLNKLLRSSLKASLPNKQASNSSLSHGNPDLAGRTVL